MRNDELFNPNCPDPHASRLVRAYVLRGLVDGRGTYYPDKLLGMQHAVYEEWLAAIRTSKPKFYCGFYEWQSRDCDSAFALKPGDLVKYNGQYCVVIGRRLRNMVWSTKWRLVDGTPELRDWPKTITAVKLKDTAGEVSIVDVLGGSIEPADIPPEIFALACGKAKDCPMMKGVMG